MPKNKDFPLPHYFNDGLKFGDPAQINYVKNLRAEAEEMEEGGLKKYHVRVYVEGVYDQIVWATCEEDAEAEVKDKFDIDYVDLDYQYDVDEMRSVK